MSAPRAIGRAQEYRETVKSWWTSQKLAFGERRRHKHAMIIAFIAIFCAGIANFAMHRAFLESDDPMVQAMIRPFLDKAGPWVTYGFEFILLLGALLLAQRNWFASLLLYGLYSVFNVMAFNWIKNRPR